MRKKKTGLALLGLFLWTLLCLNPVKVMAEEVLQFDSEGNLIMVTHDKTATGDVRYKTIGWTIKTDGNPIGTPGTSSCRIKLEMEREETDPANKKYKYTYFRCSKEAVFQAISRASTTWVEDIYLHGGIVYLDAIMVVQEDGKDKGSMTEEGVTSGKVYFSYDGISGARSWSDPTALTTHFNKAIHMPPNVTMLNGKYSIHYVEEKNGNQYSLSRYGKDQEGAVLEGQNYNFTGESLEEQKLEYDYTSVEYTYRNGDKAQSILRGEVFVDNGTYDISQVIITHYYKRHQETEQLETKGRSVGQMCQLASGTLSSDEYDITEAIPGGECVSFTGTGQSYSVNASYTRYFGIETVPVYLETTYEIYGDESLTGSYRSQVDRELYYVDRAYSYIKVDSASAYAWTRAELTNKALDQEGTEISGINRVETESQTQISYRMTGEGKTYRQTVKISEAQLENYVGKGRQQAAANQLADPIRVRNDKLQVGGVVYLSGDWADEATIGPRTEGDGDMIQVEKGQLAIPQETLNATYESSLSLIYRDLLSTREEKEENFSVNVIAVHTPVVIKAGISDDKKYNQEMKPGSNPSLILGRNFTVTLSPLGVHSVYSNEEKNYGKYVKAYEICFPFAVSYDGVSYAANTWISFSSGGSRSFSLPTNVKEGDYSVKCRAVACNATNDIVGREREQSMPTANIKPEAYSAQTILEVRVVGRLYGFQVIDVVDYPRWRSAFRRADGYSWSGLCYDVGGKDLNGQSNNSSHILPILRGSHPYNTQAGPIGLGYRVLFRMETIGDYGDGSGGIVIVPSFTHIDQDGKRTPVDLYYVERTEPETENEIVQAGGAKLIRVGSSLDLKNTHTIRVPDQDEYGILSLKLMEATAQKLNTDSVDLFTNAPESYGLLELTKALRVFHYNQALGQADTSMQTWYGEYSLPETLYVVAKGKELPKNQAFTGREDDFLKGGYLAVKFDIYTLRGSRRVLSYENSENVSRGYCNMWQTEGFERKRTDVNGQVWNLEDGEVIIFDLSKTRNKDYKSLGTH